MAPDNLLLSQHQFLHGNARTGEAHPFAQWSCTQAKAGLFWDLLPWRRWGSDITCAWGCTFQRSDDWTDVHGFIMHAHVLPDPGVLRLPFTIRLTLEDDSKDPELQAAMLLIDRSCPALDVMNGP